jgi:hypothetical protein
MMMLHTLGCHRRRNIWATCLVSLLLWLGLVQIIYAQSGRIETKPLLNLSNTPTTSTEPLLVGAPTGHVLLFWSEDVDGLTSRFTGNGNTLMCSLWDGEIWSTPQDIILSPLGGFLLQTRAVIDEEHRIHLVWMGDNPARLYYSMANASEACLSARAWTQPVVLEADLTGTIASIDIAYQPPQTLHVVYARVAKEGLAEEPRAVSYIRSEDSGLTWSSFTDLFLSNDPERGASATTIVVVGPQTLFATWSEWDGTGNSQGAYVARSPNGGQTWESPYPLALRAPDEYDQDWATIVQLPDGDRLAAIWEGGVRAFRQARYSDDGGVTWGPQQQILTDLIGENGYTRFAYDSAGRLHMFLTQRGSFLGPIPSDTQGLWQSVWEGNGWSYPRLLGGINPNIDPTAVIAQGNQFVSAWYDTQPGSDIMVLTGEVSNAPSLPLQPWPTSLPSPTPTLTRTPTRALVATPEPTVQPQTWVGASPPARSRRSSPAVLLIVTILPALSLIATMVGWQWRRIQQRA